MFRFTQVSIAASFIALVPAPCASQAKPSSATATGPAAARPPILTGAEPQPQDAQKAILALFDKYEVVAIGADHGNKDLDDFIMALIRVPAFAGRVNDLVVECGNSLFQSVLDRYIAGEAIPLSAVQQTWRNTNQPLCAVSGFYEELFPLVRQINTRLPRERRLRVLAGDPPIDWTRTSAKSESAGNRDANIAAVMETHVLSKHRKALMLFGTAHLFHGNQRSAVATYERDYPNVTYVISEHHGFGFGSPLAKDNDALESRLAAWPVPSLANVKGTWLGDLDFAYIFPDEGPASQHATFSQMADGFLYLGPRDLLLYEHMPLNVALETDYMASLQGRLGGSLEHALDVERANPALYQNALDHLSSRPGPDSGGAKARQPAGVVTWIGTFTNSRGDKRPLTLNLTTDGGKLTGTVTGGPPTGEEQPISNGKIDGDQLSWEIDAAAQRGKELSSRRSDGGRLLFRYHAKLSDNQIVGTIAGPQGDSAPFSVVKRQPETSQKEIPASAQFAARIRVGHGPG